MKSQYFQILHGVPPRKRVVTYSKYPGFADRLYHVRNAPEGEEAWAMYEEIARKAIASLSEMDPVDNTPP